MNNLALAARRFADLFARLEREHSERESRAYRAHAEALRTLRRNRRVTELDAGSIWRLA